MAHKIKHLAATVMAVLGAAIGTTLMAGHATNFSLAERGIEFHLGLTGVYQYNMSGGLVSGLGRQAGSYDLELEVDLERLAGWQGGHLYMLGEGGWQGGNGFDAATVGSLFGVNGDAGGERTFDITQLWLQQDLFDGRLRLRLGKLDLTGGFECRGCPVAFDGNQYANDETAQFLNGALVNNPAIPFPDNGLGVVVYYEPVDGWYVGVGVADGEADARESGFSTLFDGDSRLFYIVETGIVAHLAGTNGCSLPGTWRIGVWNDRGPKDDLDGDGSRTNDVGFYVSIDQALWRENSDDDQGFGVFARGAWANGDVNEIKAFYSVGGQYQGLLAGRDNDVIGLGLAHAELSHDGGFSASFERAVELYYNCEIAPWLQLTPSVQWITNPGGDRSVDDAVVAGLRVQLGF